MHFNTECKHNFCWFTRVVFVVVPWHNDKEQFFIIGQYYHIVCSFSLISLALAGQSSHPTSGCEISWMRKTTEAGVPITNPRENTDRCLPHPPVLMSVTTGQ